MGLLDKLWDDAGLGRLRRLSLQEAPTEEPPRVTRSIMIRRPAAGGTPPESPAGSATPPVSPFLGSGRRELNRFRRRSMSDAYERTAAGGRVATSTPQTPTAED